MKHLKSFENYKAPYFDNEQNAPFIPSHKKNRPDKIEMIDIITDILMLKLKFDYLFINKFPDKIFTNRLIFDEKSSDLLIYTDDEDEIYLFFLSDVDLINFTKQLLEKVKNVAYSTSVVEELDNYKYKLEILV